MVTSFYQRSANHVSLFALFQFAQLSLHYPAILAAFEDWERDFYEPTTLFSRNRKLDKVTMVKLLCLMGGNSLRKELYDYPSLKVSAPSFSERRAAISPEVLYFTLRRFSDTDSGNDVFLYKGRKLIAIDGVDFNTALNKDAPSFMPAPNTAKGGYNQYKSTVMVDLLSNQTVDMVLHPISKQNEHADAAFMVEWNDFPPCIMVCDRLYSSYPLIADFQQKGIDAKLIRKQKRDTKYRPSGSKAAKKLREQFESGNNEKMLFTMLHCVNLFSCLETLFANADDFKTEPAAINRNFVTHGMTRRSVRQRDCIQLFLALHNLMLFFEFTS